MSCTPCLTYIWEGTGCQIFDSGAQLAGFITFLTKKSNRIALVLNGDTVDFLAEPKAEPFDPHGAARKLIRIISDPAFKDVWTALNAFASKKNHTLVIVLGNHDLELALPWMRALLVDLIAGDSPEARGRITLVCDGTGFQCMVGSANVLCVHGNEADTWNVADYEAIRRVGRDIQSGRTIDPWIPNAGTRLVIEVMNEIKKDYPFVDLLKPEVEAAIPILWAVAPEKRAKIVGLLPVLRRFAQDSLRRSIGWLGAEEASQEGSPHTAPTLSRRPMNHDALMREAESRLQDDLKPIKLVSGGRDAQLGWVDDAKVWITGGSDPAETLRLKLQDLSKDQSFDFSVEDAGFHWLDGEIGASVDFILSGHTHLHRALFRKRSRGFYLNSGTWARLIELKPALMSDAKAFAALYAALSAGTMAALDASGFVMRRRSIAAVRVSNAGVRGELLRWEGGPEPLPIDPDAGWTKI